MNGILTGLLLAAVTPIVFGIIRGAILEYKAHRDRLRAADEEDTALDSYRRMRDEEEGHAGIDSYARSRIHMVVDNT